MAVGISSIRISFIWMQPRENPFRVPRVPERFAFLAIEKDYVQRFTGVQAHYEGDADGLLPPWPKHRDKNFWSLYLGMPPYYVSPTDAWRHFVPFRWRIPVGVKARLPDSRISIEGFFYPNGHAVLITLNLRCPGGLTWRPEEAASVAHRARFGTEYDLERSDGQVTSVKLDVLAKEMLARMREKSQFQDSSAVESEPYSLTTFTRVEGADPSEVIAENGEIHRMLEAVVEWDKSWMFAPLSTLKTATVPDPDFPPGHAVYRGKRGRAIWFPALSKRNGSDQCIGCYHRNQLFASLQVESIGSIVIGTAGSVRRGAPIPFVHEQVARIAAGVLGRIYGGSSKTYRSLACAYQMHDRGIIGDLIFLRDQYRMDPVQPLI